MSRETLPHHSSFITLFDMRAFWLALLTVLQIAAADYRTPAGTRPAQRTEEGAGTILPGGRLLSPFGKQFTTGPGPFGLAVSPDGKRVVTANGGPDRFSLSILEGDSIRHINLKREKDDDDEWKAAFMGLAFDGENTLFVSEGDTGRVRVIDPASGKQIRRYDLNFDKFHDSFSGDLAFDASRGILYVVDQANFRVAIVDVRNHHPIGSVAVGRLPFAIALSPDRRRLYVTNVGMFQYNVIAGADKKRPKETGLPFPPFGFPSPQAIDGTTAKNGEGKTVVIPGLGNPNAPESNSLCVVDVQDPAHASVVTFVRTGRVFGPNSLGGSSPSGVLAIGRKVFVSNSTNDSVSVIDADALRIEREIELRVPSLEKYRGVLPIGLGYLKSRKQVLVAEAGINAVGVIDAELETLLGHIPAGWFPTRVATHGDTVYVCNAKGHGIGPNATIHEPLPRSFQAERRRGSLSRYEAPPPSEQLTKQVWENDGFVAAGDPAPIPSAIKHVVIIVKENRTFDQIFGDITGAPDLAIYGKRVTPNHHALAERFAISDNFYTDSEVSADGHHWLVGSYPNEWTESSMMASYAGGRKFVLNNDAPGRLSIAESNASVIPEDQLEAGTLWHLLDRNKITFRNFGEGFEFPGIDEGKGLKPTGARLFTNIPMPDPLFRNTSRQYPGFNMNIPDQFRATQFIGEMKRTPIPQLIFIHLPNDHTADVRPQDGYPNRAAFVADNDLALGRIVEYLSHTPEWKSMAIFVTEDDPGGGADHIDAHRTVMIMASPYVRKGCVAHLNSSFPGMLKTAYRILGIGPLNLFDAAATDLSECFIDAPNFAPYNAVPIEKSVFDPAKAKEPSDAKPSVRMDDPRELKKEHRKK